MKQVLHTDQEFMRMCIPLSQKETEQLEQSIIREGCHEPITIWRGLILDGHKRYKICSYEDIDYVIKEEYFDNRDEVVIWICRNRIRKLNKSSAAYKYLVGKWYNCQKKVNRVQKRLYPDLTGELRVHENSQTRAYDRACMQLAAELGVHRATVEKYGGYATALETIYEKEPAMFHAIISGDVCFTYKEIREIMTLEQKTMYRLLKKQLKKEYIKMRRRPPQKKEEDTVEEIPLAIKVKEMPAFDPDMALKGLALTIPMWISSIARAQQQTDMTLATDDGKMKLAEMLLNLEDQIKKTLEALGW